jgi:hypothetical protein
MQSDSKTAAGPSRHFADTSSGTTRKDDAMSGTAPNEVTEGAASVQKGGVRFAAKELAEVDRQSRPVLRIARERIQGIHLRQGMQAARPVLQLAVGSFCLIVGCLLEGGLLWSWFREGGLLHLEMAGGFLCLAALGGWLAATALRRGYYLEVGTARGIEKLRIDRGLTAGEIESFLQEARSRLGYEVSDLHILSSGER